MKNLIKKQGFTLIELLITISILSIMLSIAAPNFSSLVSGSNASSAEKRLAASFSYARSEAVTRGVDVTVCSSVDSLSCSGLLQWGDGWIVHLSPDPAIAANEILRVETISELSVVYTGSTSSTCFDRLGVECTGVAAQTFSIASNGVLSTLTVASSGSLGFSSASHSAGSSSSSSSSSDSSSDPSSDSSSGGY